MKASELTAAYAALTEMGKLRLPRRVSYAIARNMAKLKPELEVLQAQELEIAKKYANTKDGELVLEGKDHNQLRFNTADAANAYIREINELQRTEITLDMVTVNASELDVCWDGDRYDIPTAGQETALAWMLTYEDS